MDFIKSRTTINESDYYYPMKLEYVQTARFNGMCGGASEIEGWIIHLVKCDSKGTIQGKDAETDYTLAFEIEVWYKPKDQLLNELQKGLERFKIFNVYDLVEAFGYRNYFART